MTSPGNREISASKEPTNRPLQIGAGLVVLLSALLVSSFDYGRDQSIYALVAREMLNGGMPYRDAFDFKPPGIFLVYAFSRALFGAEQTGIRLLEAASMIGSAWAMVKLSKRHFGGTNAGYVAAALASQVHAQLDFWHTAQPESFGATITLLGLLLAPLGAERETAVARWRSPLVRWVACGIFFGVAGLMKPPLAGAGAIPALAGAIALWSAKRSGTAVSWWEVAKPLVLTAVGGATPIVLTGLWFSATGALADLREVLFVFTPYYTKLSWVGVSTTGMIYYGLTEWLTGYSGILLAGMICLAVARPERRQVPFVLVLLGCIFVHVSGIVLQGKFFPYHWGATFPLTAMLAGLGIVRAWQGLKHWGPFGRGALVAILAIAFILRYPVPSFGDTFVERSQLRLHLATRNGTTAQWDELASVADVHAGENRAVAEYIKQRTAGREAEPIFVWGFECVIYDLAERPLASRYIYNVPQRAEWSHEPMQAALMKELAAKPPLVIVVEHRDVFAQVTGNNDDSARALYKFTALANLLESNYDYEKTIGDFDLFFRNDELAR